MRKPAWLQKALQMYSFLDESTRKSHKHNARFQSLLCRTAKSKRSCCHTKQVQEGHTLNSAVHLCKCAPSTCIYTLIRQHAVASQCKRFYRAHNAWTYALLAYVLCQKQSIRSNSPLAVFFFFFSASFIASSKLEHMPMEKALVLTREKLYI